MSGEQDLHRSALRRARGSRARTCRAAPQRTEGDGNGDGNGDSDADSDADSDGSARVRQETYR
eukprot:6193750-Pleurochrysis_carterae.AAC.1